MKRGRKHNILALLMLVFFLSYQAGISFFTHTHTVDGVVFVHSHPYNDDAHAHTDSQIFAISHLSTYWGDNPSINNDLKGVFDVVTKIGDEVEIFHFLAFHISGVNIHAPPFWC